MLVKGMLTKMPLTFLRYMKVGSKNCHRYLFIYIYICISQDIFLMFMYDLGENEICGA